MRSEEDLDEYRGRDGERGEKESIAENFIEN